MDVTLEPAQSTGAGPHHAVAVPRLRQLDALRGIAALVVVFSHYLQTVPENTRQLLAFVTGRSEAGFWLTPWPWLNFTPLRILVDGEAAVVVFFVLSGFVLTLPVTRDSQPAFWPFLIRRFCRVYLPFAAILLVVAAVYSVTAIHLNPSGNPWVGNLVGSLGHYSLLGHLLMVGDYADIVLNPVMWTLIHEMRMSFLMPVLFLSIRWVGTSTTMLACGVISVAASFGMTQSVSGSWPATAHFLWLFAAGAALSFHRHSLAARLGQAGWLTTCMLLAWAIVLLATPVALVWQDFSLGLGACLLIALCLVPSRAVRALVSPIPSWLGQISYSLYLVHLPIMILIVSGHWMPPLAGLAVMLLFAALTQVTVEAPAHRLGVLLSQRVSVPATSRQRRPKNESTAITTTTRPTR